jgi:ankyrin repeat protein
LGSIISWGILELDHPTLPFGYKETQKAISMEDRFKDAISTGNLDEVKSLLSRGVEINSTDDNGESPLHWSVATDDVKIMGVLLASGAKLDIADPNGDTALHSACVSGSVYIARTRLRMP